VITGSKIDYITAFTKFTPGKWVNLVRILKKALKKPSYIVDNLTDNLH